MGSLSSADLDGLLALAARALDSVELRFMAGIGAPSAVEKGGNDFATALDYELEQTLSELLRMTMGISTPTSGLRRNLDSALPD